MPAATRTTRCYRDMAITLDATASIVPDGRYPAPTEVVPGQKLRTTAGTAEHRAAGLPGALRLRRRAAAGGPQRAAGQGLDRDQRHQHQGARAGRRPARRRPPRTTITVDPADDNRFLSATPWQYNLPRCRRSSGPRVGGDVVFGQDARRQPAASCRSGTAARNRAVTGSTVIHIAFPAGGAIYMDCRPGRTTGDESRLRRADVRRRGRRRRSTPRPDRATRPA